MLFFSSWLRVSAADKPLSAVAEAAAKKLKSGGIVIGESLDGKVTFAGFASPADKTKNPAEPYTEKVLFEIGSITKVFTGLLLAKAVVEEKVTLDTPIAKLLDPKLKFEDPRIAAITLKQLSTHTSGLPRLPSNQALGSREDDPYAGYDEKLLIDYLTHAKLKKDGPYPSSYSNLGVGLLGHLLGKVYGTTWEDAIVTQICQPLGMNETRMTITGLKLPLAKPHDEEKDSTSWHFDAVAGAGALRSTAADMIRFGQAMAKPETTPLSKALALAMQPHAEASGDHIGLGPFIGKREGVTTYNHDGGTGGYRSGLQVIPEKNIVRVVLINNTQLDGSSIIADTRIVPPRVMPKEGKIDPALLPEYTGVYEIDQDSRFTVLLHQNHLWVRLTGQAFLRLFAKDKETDRFFYKSVNAEVQFTREGGKIISMTLFQNGRELPAKRTLDPAPKIVLHTADELKPYTGKYFLMGLKELNVTVRGNTLYAQLADQPAVPVFDMGKDRFEYDVVVAILTFNRNEQNEILGLTLLQNGFPVPALRAKPEAK